MAAKIIRRKTGSKKKTSIGNGRGSRFKSKGSAENPSKGYRKKPRGQGRG